MHKATVETVRIYSQVKQNVKYTVYAFYKQYKEIYDISCRTGKLIYRKWMDR